MNEKQSTREDIQKKEKELQQEAERKAILMKADENKQETLELNFDRNTVKDEIDELKLNPVDNPEEKYNRYYKVINKLLTSHLPKGKDLKKARNLIYEEKNTFLTRGHRKDKKGMRGADGRMGYTDDMEEMVKIIYEWIVRKESMYELYTKMRDLNIAKGYGYSQGN